MGSYPNCRVSVTSTLKTASFALQSFREINLDIKQEVILCVTENTLKELMPPNILVLNCGGGVLKYCHRSDHLEVSRSHTASSPPPVSLNQSVQGQGMTSTACAQGHTLKTTVFDVKWRKIKPCRSKSLSEMEGVRLSHLRCSPELTLHDNGVQLVTK